MFYFILSVLLIIACIGWVVNRLHLTVLAAWVAEKNIEPPTEDLERLTKWVIRHWLKRS